MRFAMLAAGVVAFGLTLRRVGWAPRLSRRLPVVLVAAALVVAAAVAVGAIAGAPASIWNDMRLAPSAALLRGYPLYSLPGQGPMLGHMYGPVSPLVYLPAVLPSSPDAAMRAGAAISLALCLLPAVLVALAAPRSSATMKAAVVLAFALYCFRSDVLWSVALSVHADTPAVAFALLACVPLMDPARRLDPRHQALSALAVVLACGSKQIAVPIVLAIPAYLWMTEGWRAAGRYAALVAGWALTAAAIMAAAIDVPAMMYHTLIVPAGHGWRFDDGAEAFLQTLVNLVPRALPLAVVPAVYLFLLWRRDRTFSAARWAAEHPWILPLLVWAFCLPTAILGRMKVGGSLAALTFGIYPLAIAALVAVLQIAAGRAAVRRAAAPRLGLALALGALAALAVEALPRALMVGARVASLDDTRTAAAVSFIRAHPGQVYLPLNPLVTLQTEGRADHLLLPQMSAQYFAYAAGGESLSATTADDEVIGKFLPPDLRYVLLPAGNVATVSRGAMAEVHEHLRHYLPAFTAAAPGPPGWDMLASSTGPAADLP